MKTLLLLLIATLSFAACKKSEPPAPPVTGAKMYFPPTGGTTWDETTPSTLGWSEAALTDLYTYLGTKGTKGFILLKDGRIVAEKYFGTFNRESTWYWASAGKTMTAVLVGIAQDEGKLLLSDPSSKYLGKGWTSLAADREAAITIRHQLSMTTGLDDVAAGDTDCTLPSCLLYKSDPGTRWAYHNAPYTLLARVVEKATSATYNSYYKSRIGDAIGMNGLWIQSDYNNVFHSDTRSAARFGLLMLNKGTWNGTKVMKNEDFIGAQVARSQLLNPSYGYLTWLNGKEGYMLPSIQNRFTGPLVPNAPVDLYAALGKNDQKIYVVPSQNLVVVRFGEAADNGFLALSSFDNELWGKLKSLIRY